MSSVSPEDFEAFFKEVYDYPPFPWQTRLMRRVLELGEFPAALDLPTGSGKTAAIDVAVFALAVDLAAGRRRLPCRIAFVVDRRTVVDQSFLRAQRLARCLKESAPDSVARRVADQLRALAGGDDPLRVSLLRGAVPRDDTWAANPAQPTVLVSTVDQVGSRLFFRGYGVSDGMRPIHAGLLGNDLLLLLDEVHLARPFCDTLRMLERYHADRIGPDLPRRFQVSELSATHRDGGAVSFRLEADDREAPSLKRRLTARKPASLVQVKVSGDEPARLAALAKKMAAAVVEAVVPGRAIGVVVNRVQTARLIFDDLMARGIDADLRLLTGRMRPLDRQELEVELQSRFASDRDRNLMARSTVLVATQCIEAGADFDFDTLLTECASLDALRQRFGRLNRAGCLEDASGSVFARSDIDARDPIYGDAAATTWRYLSGLPSVDFGSEMLPLPEGEELAGLMAPAATSPILLPAHLDAWSQTSPVPFPDPDVSLWLHGPQEPSAEVLVVWRADLDEEELRAASSEGGGGGAASITTTLTERLDACSPLTSEGLAVPVWAIRRWLNDGGAHSDSELADVECGVSQSIEEGSGRARPVLVLRSGQTLIIGPDEIRPWDTVVVPRTYGGIRARNWDPGSSEPVADLAEAAHLRQRGRALLRLDERLWSGINPPVPTDEEGDEGESIHSFLAGFLDEAGGSGGDGSGRVEVVRRLCAELERRPGPRFIRVKGRDGGDCWVVVSRQAATPAEPVPGLTSPDLAFDGDGPSLIGRAVPLRSHLAGVGRMAEGFARRCGLPDVLVGDLRLAGELHDLGKNDPRFQCLLQGGSEYRALTAPEPLAKSSLSSRNRRLQNEARRRSGYPAGTRHELVSLALLQEAERLRAKAHDWELVLHLVASHHGYCRPLAPVEPESEMEPIWVGVDLEGETFSASTDHGLAALDSGVSDRYFTLTERYGCHGLVWLEAILRLADHRRSAQEEGES